MTLSDMGLSKKLLLSFSLVVLALVAVTAVVLNDLRRIQVATTQTDMTVAIVDKVNGVSKAMLDLSGQVRGYLLTQDDAFVRGVELDKGEVKSLLDALRRDVGIESEKAQLEEIAKATEGYISEAGDPELRLGHDPSTIKQALEIIRSGANKKWMNAFKAAAKSFVDTQGQSQAAHAAIRDDAIQSAQAALLVGAVVAFAVAGLMGWLLSRQIAVPVVAMTEAMKRLASGDTTALIPATGRKDEVGQMAAAVKIFKEAAIEKVRLEGEAADTRRVADDERTRHEAERAGAAREQAHVVRSLAAGLEKLSDSNLMFRLKEPFAPEYESLRANFNNAMKKLEETMTIVAQNTSAIRSGTTEISTASDDLSRRTEQQAASLEETAAALDEITATVKKTSDGSRHAQKVVGSAKSDAEHSGLVVSQAIEAMSAIEQSAHKISQIIGVIDEIAFQTNLLALNAGVEAARAGEAGRGFAVVASEVRALAQRSAEAAKEIKALISTSSQQVGAGVNLVNETGDALKRIVTQVAEINAVVSDIATSTQEQATALQQVNTAINQMDQVTQQNAAMVEESTAASKNLAQETEELARLIGQFQLETGNSPSAAPTPARPARKTVAALKTTGIGGAARKPEAATQSWEEF